MHEEQPPPLISSGPSMWVKRPPFEDEYARRTSLLALLRSMLPSWLGGKPIRILRAQSKGGLLRSKSLESDLELQLVMARAQGKPTEVESLTLRLAALKALGETKETSV